MGSKLDSLLLKTHDPLNPRLLLQVSHRAKAFIVFLTLVLIGVIFLSPKYLTFASKPIKANAVVLIPGPIYELRKKEALKIINQGYTRFLIFPSTGEVWEYQGHGRSIRKRQFSFPATINKQYRRFYENTHIEILRTKKMMEDLGLTSAIFVSSPYHMLRIQIIANRELDIPSENVFYVPAAEHKTVGWKWWLSRSDWWWVANEYVKIGWFLVSRNFLSTV